MVTEIKELRVKIDALAQLTKEMLVVQGIDRYGIELKFQPVEIGETYKSLLLAKAWLGKVLGELGETTPYTNDGQRKTVEEIEPVADNYLTQDRFKVPELIQVGNNKTFNDLNYIEKVDWLREEIKSLIEKVKEIINVFICDKIYYDNIVTHLTEARFWLGFELGRIKGNGTI